MVTHGRSHAGVLVATLLLTACAGAGKAGASTPAAPQATPAPTATASLGTAGPFAVLVERSSGAEPYLIQLVRPDGRALPGVHAMGRALKTYRPPASPCPSDGCPTSATANSQLPEASISASHVYFLDGEADVKSLSPTGSVAAIRHLDVPPNSNAAFAVSRDDRRIAVAIITYATAPAGPPFSLRLYVEDLAGGNRNQEFTSTSIVEWPVGWRGSDLVVAVGQPGILTGFNPYGAIEYHLVGAATFARRALLSCNFGPLVAAGSACWRPGSLGWQDWTGTALDYRLDPSGTASHVQSTYLALAPDGSRVAAAVSDAGGYDTELFGDGSEALLVREATPLGWLDGGHLLVIAASGPALAAVPGGTLTPVTGFVSLPGQGRPALLGVLPAALG